MNKSKSIQKYYMRAKRVCRGSSNISSSNIYFESNENEIVEKTVQIEQNVEEELPDCFPVFETNCLPVSSTHQSDFIDADVEETILHNIHVNDDFKTKLRNWALRYNITHVALNELLRLLKTTSNDLPLDSRTLLGTTREINSKQVEPGKYYHFGLKYCLENIVSNLSESKRNMELIEININIDGLPLSKSSSSQAYPILCSIVGFNFVDMVGIYHGNEKPKNANEFLAEFVEDITSIINNGTVINGKFYNVKIKAFICDAPAKSFIKYTKSHTGYSSCSKCQIEGDYINNRVCFPNGNNNIQLRTDLEFRSKVDENHHNGTSLIENIPGIDMINSFPLDYMHLICLGVMKKILLLWCCGKPSTKISFQKISTISSLLIKLSPYITREFNRKPRSLNELKRWKATEFRQFLFYTGPLVLKNNISKDRYHNFLALHVAVTILSNSQYKAQINYAFELLNYFVNTFKILYGSEQISHNVHNLLHLVQDVKNHGSLDSFSAFPFENFLQSILKSLRKCDKPLEQIVKRHSEKINVSSISKQNKTFPIYRDQHYPTLLLNYEFSKHFKTVAFEHYILCIEEPNNCCHLKTGEIISIRDIVLYQNRYKIVGSKYLNLRSVYDVPCKSSEFGIYESVKVNANNLGASELFDVDNVDYKCIKFEYPEKSVILPVLHTSHDTTI